MESNYKIAYKSEWKKLKRKNPNEIAKSLELEYCDENRQYTIVFLNQEYILDCDLENIYRKEDGHIPSISASIIMLNYLTFSESTIQINNKWVSLKEIPNGGMLFYPAFYKSAIKNLINTFGYNIKKFNEHYKELGGQPGEFGDKSAVFKILPKIYISIIIWEGDEEILPNATILFDTSIEHLIHIETIIGLGEYLVGRLIK